MTAVRPLSDAALHALMECNAGRVHRAGGSATWYSRDDGHSEALNAAVMRALFARGLIRAERRDSLLGGSRAVVTGAGHLVIDAHLDAQHGPAYPEVAAAPPPFPMVEVDPAEIEAEIADWWDAGEAERSADRLRYGDVDSTATETGRTDL